MNSSLNHGSAKIYQFPPGGRAALGGRSYDEAKPATETPGVNEAACSGRSPAGAMLYVRARLFRSISTAAPPRNLPSRQRLAARSCTGLG